MMDALATFRKVESPHPVARVWYEVLDTETGRVLGRVTRDTDSPRSWDGWVRYPTGEHVLTVRRASTRNEAVRLMWDDLS